jgi:hypothetical protein
LNRGKGGHDARLAVITQVIDKVFLEDSILQLVGTQLSRGKAPSHPVPIDNFGDVYMLNGPDLWRARAMVCRAQGRKEKGCQGPF